jgi:hypothetical protein
MINPARAQTVWLYCPYQSDTLKVMVNRLQSCVSMANSDQTTIDRKQTATAYGQEILVRGS